MFVLYFAGLLIALYFFCGQGKTDHENEIDYIDYSC